MAPAEKKLWAIRRSDRASMGEGRDAELARRESAWDEPDVWTVGQGQVNEWPTLLPEGAIRCQAASVKTKRQPAAWIGCFVYFDCVLAYLSTSSPRAGP